MLHPLAGSGGGVGQRGELGEDEHRAAGAGEDGAVARPGRSELGQEAVRAGEGVADGERFGRVHGRGGGGRRGGGGEGQGRGGGGGLDPEVEKGRGGCDGGEGLVGEEVCEGEAEPGAARGVEGVEAAAAVGARVAEEEKAQGGEQREELRREGLVEEARDGAAHDGVAQLQPEQHVVERVRRQVVDRRRGLRFRGRVGAGAGGHGGFGVGLGGETTPGGEGTGRRRGGGRGGDSVTS